MAMTSAKFFVVLTIMGLVALAGCGTKVNLREADNPDEVTPPATAGSVEALTGTWWEFPEHGMLVSFSQPPTARLANPANPAEGGPASWNCRADGVVTVTAMGTTFAGTWDGSTVVLSGDTGVRKPELE
jgi:hypothetical protein